MLGGAGAEDDLRNRCSHRHRHCARMLQPPTRPSNATWERHGFRHHRHGFDRHGLECGHDDEGTGPVGHGKPDTTTDLLTVTEVEAYGECNNDAECEGVLDGFRSHGMFLFPDGKYGFKREAAQRTRFVTSVWPHPRLLHRDGDARHAAACGAVGGGNGVPPTFSFIAPATIDDGGNHEAGRLINRPNASPGSASRARRPGRTALKCQTNEDCAGPTACGRNLHERRRPELQFCIFMWNDGRRKILSRRTGVHRHVGMPVTGTIPDILPYPLNVI